MSRWRLKNPRVIRFRRQSGFWRPRWFLPRIEPFQERIGGRIALVTEIEGPGAELTVYNLHLESRGNNDLRLAQMEEALQDAPKRGPSITNFIGWRSKLRCFGSSSSQRTAGLWLPKCARAAISTYNSAARVIPAPAPHRLGVPIRPIEATLGHVHGTIKASDHYPISFYDQVLLSPPRCSSSNCGFHGSDFSEPRSKNRSEALFSALLGAKLQRDRPSARTAIRVAEGLPELRCSWPEWSCSAQDLFSEVLIGTYFESQGQRIYAVQNVLTIDRQVPAKPGLLK
jgi:hypothetical protein